MKKPVPPPLPRVVLHDGLPAHLGEQVRLQAYARRHYNHYNVFRTAERGGFRLAAIHVHGAQPADREATVFPLGHGIADPHVCFEDDKGVFHAFHRCAAAMRGTSLAGVFVADDRGQGWAYGAPRDAGPDQDKRLHRISLDEIPYLKATGIRLRDLLPFEGVMELDGETVARVGSGRKPAPDAPEIMAALRLVGEVNTREDRIRGIFDRHFPEGSLDFLKEGLEPPVSKDRFSDHVHKMRPRLDEHVMAFMEEMKRQGLLGKCPNNGPRGVSEFDAWNVWIDGAVDRWRAQSLARTPAFSLPRRAIISAMVSVSMDIEKAKTPGGKIDFRNRPAIELTGVDIDRIITDAHADMRENFVLGEADGSMNGTDYRCMLTGEPAYVHGAIYTPVLHRLSRGSSGFEALPALDALPPIRHLELPLPSGHLAMADWFRIDGFTEGLKALVGTDDRYEINYASGLDERARDYFTKAGLVIVQVGNTSPAAYADGGGIWRMGRVNEDHDAFWTEDGKPTGQPCPEEAWTTCTDLWANVFADRETVAGILMASGRYPDRGAADRALEDFCRSHEAVIVNLGVDRIHVYSQTGAGHVQGEFGRQFRSPDIPEQEWMRDDYILSSRPLAVDPSLLEMCGWQAATHPGSPAPEPDGPSP